MKLNEPSRTALIVARQRAAHQVLDHGAILHDPFAMAILREEEKDVLQFATAHPLASIGRLFTAARSRIAEDALSGAVEQGIRQIVEDITFQQIASKFGQAIQGLAPGHAGVHVVHAKQ